MVSRVSDLCTWRHFLCTLYYFGGSLAGESVVCILGSPSSWQEVRVGIFCSHNV